MVLTWVLCVRLEFIATRAKGPTRGAAQARNGAFAFFRSVNQFLIQRSYNAVGTDQDFANHIFMLSSGL